MKKSIITIALAAAFLSTGSFAETIVSPGVSAGIESKLLVRGDLQGLQVVDLRSQRRNDLVTVQAEIYNHGLSDTRLYYRFRWTDASGMQVGDGEVWKPLVFLGKQSQTISGVAYGPQAVDFRIEMSSEPR
jgi:uncharacterized protein YcfL